MTEYKIIFADGYTDDIESFVKELRCDVLIMDESGRFFNPQFITIDRIKGEFGNDRSCYVEENLVILREVTKEAILNSIPELHKWLFYQQWLALDSSQVEKCFYPTDVWVTFSVLVE